MKTYEKILLAAAIGAVIYMGISQKDNIADAVTEAAGDFDSYDDLFKAAAAKYKISDWLILKAIAWNESSVGQDASVVRGIESPDDADGSKSADGLSWGIMQFTLDTANWLRPNTSVRDLNSPEVSIDLAGKYVSYLLGRFGGDLQKAVEAYNEGPGNVAKGVPDDDYWNKFQRHYTSLQQQA